MKSSLPQPAAPPATTSANLVGRMALRFGVAGGIVCAGWMLGLQATGNNPFGPKLLLAQLVVPLLAVAAEWRLRQRLAPAKPGIGRQLTLGGLVVLLAALISASSMVGLANGAGEEKLVALNRTEAREITLADMQAQPKERRNSAQEQKQLEKIEHLSIIDFAISNLTVTLLLGLALAVPGGIFFRE